MTLTDQLGIIEAERNSLKVECESLRTRVAKQAGALEESRAENRQLIARNEKLSAHVAHVREVLLSFGNSATRMEAERKELEQRGQLTMDVVNSPPQVATIKQRIASIMKREEVAANGQAKE